MKDRVIDISRNKETGDITQFTILDDSGQPTLKKATPENILLYDPADELPFDDGMSGFLSGSDALVLQEGDPLVMVAPTGNDYCYILRVRDNTVETTPSQAERVLRGIKDAAIDGEVKELINLYDHIMSTQVRRGVVNALKETFDEDFRISTTGEGWLIDDFFLIDWSASMYAKHNDPDEADVIRGGSGVKETDKSYEFVQLRLNRETDPVEVAIGGDTFRLTEREMLFLAKVKWLLNRRDYHPDQPFWMFVEKNYTKDIDWETGEYVGDGNNEQSEEEDTDDPASGGFNL